VEGVLIDARCRVTVIGARNQVDLAIPADAPIAGYNVQLARLLEQPEDDALPPVWSLAPIGAAAFPVASSLAREGVEDGAVLYLRDTLADEDKEPVVRSVLEMVQDVAEKSAGVPWNGRIAGRLAVVLGAYWLAAALWYLGLTGDKTLGVGVIAGALGICLAVLARVLRDYPRALPARLRTVLACAAVPTMALAAVLAPGAPVADLTHLTYLAIGVVIGIVVALIAVPDVMLGALTVLIAMTGLLVAILVPLGASGPSIAATVVVTGVLFLAIAPRTAGMLVAVSWLSMSRPTPGPDADPDHLGERVSLAHRALIVMVSVTSTAVGIALIILTRHFEPFTAAVAVVATVVLILRTNTFELATEAIAPVIAAAVGVFGLLNLLGSHDTSRPYQLPAMLVVGVAAVSVGLPVLLWGARSSSRRDRPRPGKMSPLLTIGQIVLPALMLGVYGLYSTLWNVGR
jgi:ESX secretion system protein EccD